MLCALLNHIFRPYRCLYLSDVRFLQEEHTQTALTDSAADGQRILSGDDTLMEWLLQTVFFPSIFN